MLQDLKRLGKDSLIYGIGTVSRSLIGFILIPLYTRYLTTEEYGILALALVALASLIILFELGMSKALFRFYFEAENENDRNTVIGTCLLVLLIFGIPLLILLFVFAPTGSRLALSSTQYSTFWILVSASAFIEALITLPYAVLRAKMRSRTYTVFFVLNLILLVSLTSLFLVGLGGGINGILAARLLSSAVILLCFVPLLLRTTRFAPARTLVRDLLLYGLPFVPLGLIGWGLRYINRYFLEHFTSLETIGIYSLGGQVGMAMIILVVSPFQLVWAPYKFIIAKGPRAQEKFSLFFTYFFFLTAFIGLGLSALAPEIVRIMSTPPYYQAGTIVPWIVLAYILYGLSFNLNIGIDLKKKTYLLPLITGCGLLIGVICNYLLIPSYGMLGAAWAFAASYTVLPVLMYVICRHYYRINYEIWRLIHIAAAAGALYLLARIIDGQAFSLGTTIGLKILIVVLFFPLLLATGFFSRRERTKIRKIWATRFLGQRSSP